MHACVCTKSLKSCLTLCDPMDCSLPGSSVHGILQTRILERVAMPSSQMFKLDLEKAEEPEINCQHPLSESEVAQSCPTFCNPVDCSLPVFSVHGMLQARILEWVTISFSRGYSWPRDRTKVSHTGGRCFNLWAIREAPYMWRNHIYVGPTVSYMHIFKCAEGQYT